MTMIERVTRAILKRRYYDCEPEMYEGLEEFYSRMYTAFRDLWSEAEEEARAAIEAMREPTMSQLGAAQKAWLADPARRSSTIYQAMIDQAMKDGA